MLQVKLGVDSTPDSPLNMLPMHAGFEWHFDHQHIIILPEPDGAYYVSIALV